MASSPGDCVTVSKSLRFSKAQFYNKDYYITSYLLGVLRFKLIHIERGIWVVGRGYQLISGNYYYYFSLPHQDK